jgi:hypothetical protein
VGSWRCSRLISSLVRIRYSGGIPISWIMLIRYKNIGGEDNLVTNQSRCWWARPFSCQAFSFVLLMFLYECCTNVTLMSLLRYVTSLCIIWVDSGWGPLYYTQVIRWGRVSTYESKTKIYFWKAVLSLTACECDKLTHTSELYPATFKHVLPTNEVTNMPQLQEKTTKYLNFLYLVINDL